MTYVIRFSLIAFSFSFPLFAFAQIIDTSNVAASQEKRLKEVVVQATRTSAQSPVPHTNLSAAALAQTLQTQDVPMLLTATPSLVESSDAGIGIGYTGMRIRGSDPTRINITINGVPFNDAESQGVYWVDMPDVAASAAEIQVQRGVGSSSNGAGAFGATVNVDLSKVSADPGASATATVGAFGTRKFSAQANTGLLSGRWSFSGRASTIHSDGYIDRATADLNSLHLSGAYLGDRQSVQVHILSGKEITYQAWNGVPAQYIDDQLLRRFNTAGGERPGAPYDQQVDHYTQRHLLAHYKRVLTPQLSLQLNGHYTKGFGYYEQYKAHQKYTNYGLAPLVLGDTTFNQTDLIRRLWLDNDFYGATFALRWTAEQAKNTSMLLGGALSRYEGLHFGEIIWSENPLGQPKDFRYYDNIADKRDGNLYLKVEHGFGNDFTAFLDLQGRMVRYDFLGYNQELVPTNQQVRHFFFNPKVGATYTPAKNWTVYTFLGVAQREPNRDDYTQSSPESRPKAEWLTDVETGLRFDYHGATASANLFYMLYRDQLVLDGRINDVGAYIRTNVPDSYRAGIELEGAVPVGQRLTVNANCAISRNKIRQFNEFVDNWDTGEQTTVTHRNVDLAFSPGLIARAEAGFLLWKWTGVVPKDHVSTKNGRIALALSGKYVGKQYLDNTSSNQASLPGYFVSDLRFNVDCSGLIGKTASFIFSVNNWLDARYSSNGWVYRYVSAGYDARPDDPYTRLEGGDVYQQAGFFPQAGRHWMATLRVGF